MSHKVPLRRDFRQLRPSERDALNEVVGLDWYYPIDKLDQARVDAEITRPGAAASVDTLAVFFRLINYQDIECIEIVEQPFPSLFNGAGFIVAGSEGANLTIEDKVINGHFAMSSVIDGRPVEFDYQFGGQYAPSEGPIRSQDTKRQAAA
jgi:hypothetical protein